MATTLIPSPLSSFCFKVTLTKVKLVAAIKVCLSTTWPSSLYHDDTTSTYVACVLFHFSFQSPSLLKQA